MSSGQAGLAEYFHANKAMFWCKPQLKGKYFCECCRFRSKESLSIGLCLDVEEAIFTELQNATVVVPNLCPPERWLTSLGSLHPARPLPRIWRAPNLGKLGLKHWNVDFDEDHHVSWDEKWKKLSHLRTKVQRLRVSLLFLPFLVVCQCKALLRK